METFQASLQGLTALFVWPTFGLMLVGVAIGVGTALLPGLGGGVTALAIVIPFIWGSDPFVAMAVVGGLMGATGISGAFSATLFNVPGAPSNAATILDAYPMAKKGEAGRALGAAFTSSAIGGLLGALALGITIPIVRPLVLLFASPERFMLILLAVLAIGALAGNHPLKGLLAGVVGILISFVGMDPQTGIPRYTFDQVNLLYGVALVPLIMGMFAVPEVVDLFTRGRVASEVEVVSEETKGVWQGVVDSFRYWTTILRASAIGIIGGIMPAVGGTASAFWAYAYEAQFIGGKGKFGKGDVRGVIAPEAANNAVTGGDLIPTLAFGVPGSAMCAVMMAALMLVGVTPGPSMLKEQLPLTFFITWTVAVAGIVGSVICLVLTTPLSKISKVRANILVPFILLFVFLGSYVEQTSIMDVFLTLLLGALGYVMMRLHWPRSPLLVGFILGNLAERYFFTSYLAWGFSFVLRPASVVLLLVLIASMAYPFIRRPQSEAVEQEA
ncbi:MAG: tripartite tricarboxylate transporter permease [Chloroflexi bacterium]|nr:tripartite tricarboxylate transporter permease [Chloroflexota bacterium]